MRFSGTQCTSLARAIMQGHGVRVRERLACLYDRGLDYVFGATVRSASRPRSCTPPCRPRSWSVVRNAITLSLSLAPGAVPRCPLLRGGRCQARGSQRAVCVVGRRAGALQADRAATPPSASVLQRGGPAPRARRGTTVAVALSPWLARTAPELGYDDERTGRPTNLPPTTAEKTAISPAVPPLARATPATPCRRSV